MERESPSTSKAEQLLELIALELAHSRLRGVEELSTLAAFKDAIELKQAALNILPIKQKAERLGIKVIFYYETWQRSNHQPPLAIKNELEDKVWQDPRLSIKLETVNKRQTIVVNRRLQGSNQGFPESVDLYTLPEYSAL